MVYTRAIFIIIAKLYCYYFLLLFLFAEFLLKQNNTAPGIQYLNPHLLFLLRVWNNIDNLNCTLHTKKKKQLKTRAYTRKNEFPSNLFVKPIDVGPLRQN